MVPPVVKCGCKPPAGTCRSPSIKSAMGGNKLKRNNDRPMLVLIFRTSILVILLCRTSYSEFCWLLAQSCPTQIFPFLKFYIQKFWRFFCMCVTLLHRTYPSHFNSNHKFPIHDLHAQNCLIHNCMRRNSYSEFSQSGFLCSEFCYSDISDLDVLTQMRHNPNFPIRDLLILG